MSFIEITKQKYYDAVKNPKPLIAGFSITHACNLKCRLCGVAAGKPVSGELTTKEAKAALDNLAEAGVMHLSFGGGEPLVRDDILELASYASRKIRSVGIVSNGLLIDRSLAWKISEAGIKQVMVSLDGDNAVTHDSNRGEGSFESALDALKHLKHVHLSARISFTISQANFSQLSGMVDLAKDYGVSLNVQEFFAKGRAEGKEKLILTRKQRREMQRFLYKIQAEMGAGSIGFENRYIISEDEISKRICTNEGLGSGFYDFCVGCFTGIYSFFVSPTGEVRLCGRYGEGSLGNLKETALAEIWQNSEILKHIRNRENLTGRCGKCAYRYICGGCRRNAWHLQGDVYAEDPLCWRGRTDEELNIVT